MVYTGVASHSQLAVVKIGRRTNTQAGPRVHRSLRREGRARHCIRGRAPFLSWSSIDSLASHRFHHLLCKTRMRR